MRGLRAAAALLLLLPAAPLPAAGPRETTVDALLVSLDIERRSRAQDVDELERLNARIARAEAAAASARTRLAQSLREGENAVEAIENAEETVAEAEARVAAAEQRRRALVARIADRARRMASISDELARRRAGPRAADPVSGRWDVVINPGPRRGVFRLSLDGTLVSGTYTLDGNFHGSVRGTYIGDKLTLQRIDSERGIDATFYGRVGPRRIAGTWETTAIAPAEGPGGGTWAGTWSEKDESEGETP